MKKVCGAKRRDGQPCQAPAMENGRCRIHGGKTPRGLGLPQTTHGRYSKALPGNLLQAYAQAQADSELLSIRDDIALVDAMLSGALERLDTRESAKTYKDLRDAIGELEKAFANEDYGVALITMHEIRDVIDERVVMFAVEQEVRQALEQRRKLVESERKRLVEMQQVVTSEQAMVLVSGLLEAVRQNVNDRTILNAIQSDFIRLTQGTNRQRVISETDI